MLKSFAKAYTSTFNRTSMESKQIDNDRAEIILLALLIEPVWNRNLFRQYHVGRNQRGPFNRTSMESKHFTTQCMCACKRAFNRTSMESKLRVYSDAFSFVLSFNRTSMESKLSAIL